MRLESRKWGINLIVLLILIMHHPSPACRLEAAFLAAAEQLGGVKMATPTPVCELLRPSYPHVTVRVCCRLRALTISVIIYPLMAPHLNAPTSKPISAIVYYLPIEDKGFRRKEHATSLYRTPHPVCRQ